ncbi:sterol desaturase family protein [Lysobacter sp. A03]|uniref:sterol desaturase family protein n=1 Tax=Lysobacter sp. A03 TaxID=1199154 RepID=UPI0005B6B160|nr:sterol desaturase family protein [Lysobacter sp. A03]KIQ97011.1 putative desaturase [Lysobacter sp. A03]
MGSRLELTGITRFAHDFIALPPWQVVLWATLYFAVLYFVTGAVTWWLTQSALPRVGFGRVLDQRPLRPGQLRREIAESCSSILLFGVGVLVPWWLLRSGWAGLAHEPSGLRIVLELLALFLWNELHFYVCHRLLHTRPLRRFHADHHRSLTPTPFSTYAFHPVETLLLGSVPILPMLVHDFSPVALFCLPVMSIVLNNLGHANYEFSRRAPAGGPLAASRRHHLHHAVYHGNYGFLLDVLDRLAGTTIDAGAADHLAAPSHAKDSRE